MSECVSVRLTAHSMCLLRFTALVLLAMMMMMMMMMG